MNILFAKTCAYCAHRWRYRHLRSPCGSRVSLGLAIGSHVHAVGMHDSNQSNRAAQSSPKLSLDQRVNRCEETRHRQSQPPMKLQFQRGDRHRLGIAMLLSRRWRSKFNSAPASQRPAPIEQQKSTQIEAKHGISHFPLYEGPGSQSQTHETNREQQPGECDHLTVISISERNSPSRSHFRGTRHRRQPIHA
jgi:hypothetical protein